MSKAFANTVVRMAMKPSASGASADRTRPSRKQLRSAHRRARLRWEAATDGGRMSLR